MFFTTKDRTYNSHFYIEYSIYKTEIFLFANTRMLILCSSKATLTDLSLEEIADVVWVSVLTHNFKNNYRVLRHRTIYLKFYLREMIGY